MFRGLFGALWSAWLLVTWPFRSTLEWLVAGWRRAKFRNLLYGIPALIALISLGILWQAARVNARTIDTKYLDQARRAMEKENYGAAEVFLARVIADSNAADKQASFDLGEVYEQTDRKERAMGIFRDLAPDDRRGYPPAHRKQAMLLADQLTSQSDGDHIRLVRHHLTHADAQRTPVMARAWASYYLALNQAEPAIERLELAVQQFPELSLLLGDLYLTTGKVENARTSFSNASDFLRERVEKDPQNRAARITFANTLLKLGDLNECRAVLELGLKLDPDGPYKQLLASLFTNRHDAMAQQEGNTVSSLLTQLRIALTYDPTFTPAYERLVSYGEGNVEGGGDLSDILADVIARGKEPGLAHFAMSILKWKENDIPATKWHLERAYSLLPDMPFVANNLAWILATEDPVDIDQALEVISPVVEKYPNEPRLLDTHATILMKQEKWTEALDGLERALMHQKNENARAELHTKLAEVCEQLNQSQLAAKHRELANENASPAGQQ